jgi:U6 snRNA-associated Sm-like protein LSm7
MSDRVQHRGRGRGGRGGGGGGGGRGGGQHHHGSQTQQQSSAQAQERPKKENILDLKKYMDKRVTAKFNGGREGSFHSYCRPFVRRRWVMADMVLFWCRRGT